MKWQEFRGGVAGLTWGVSLTFVPENPKNLNSEKIKWKRTLKSAQMDISIGINHEIILNGEAPGQFDELNPPTFHGEKAYVRFTKTSWTLLKPLALRYLEELNRVQPVIDYINLMREQPISNQWHHWDLPKAFCMARLGKIAEAQKLIKKYFEPWKAEAEFNNLARSHEEKLLITLDDIKKPA